MCPEVHTLDGLGSSFTTSLCFLHRVHCAVAHHAPICHLHGGRIAVERLGTGIWDLGSRIGDRDSGIHANPSMDQTMVLGRLRTCFSAPLLLCCSASLLLCFHPSSDQDSPSTSAGAAPSSARPKIPFRHLPRTEPPPCLPPHEN